MKLTRAITENSFTRKRSGKQRSLQTNNAFLPASFISPLLTCLNGPINKNKKPLANTFISIICLQKAQPSSMIHTRHVCSVQQPIRCRKILGNDNFRFSKKARSGTAKCLLANTLAGFWFVLQKHA